MNFITANHARVICHEGWKTLKDVNPISVTLEENRPKLQTD